MALIFNAITTVSRSTVRICEQELNNRTVNADKLDFGGRNRCIHWGGQPETEPATAHVGLKSHSLIISLLTILCPFADLI